MTHVSANCPYCKEGVSFNWITMSGSGGQLFPSFQDYFSNKHGVWGLGECPRCKECVLLNLLSKNSFENPKKVYPIPLPTSTDKRIPNKIKKDIEEAKLCFSVGALRACATMCRRALQQACIEKGTTKKDLMDQIEEIATNGVITSDLKDLAHSIRWVGNDAAHPEKEEVTKEDSEEILRLAEQFMDVIFVAPAKVREIKQRRGK